MAVGEPAGSSAGTEITASGTHCIWPLDTFFDGGFRPGDPPDCDKIDVEGPITFFLLDHGEWESGDMLDRWDPTGTVGPAPFAGAWVASFLAL